MKSLITFIKESEENEVENSKTFLFDFNDIENAEEIIEYLKEHSDIISEEDKKFTLNISKENIDDEELLEVIDKLSEFIKEARKSTKNSSSEQYAQKTRKLLNSIDGVKEYIDSVKSSADETSNNENE